MGPQGVTYVDPADDAEKVALTANRSRPGQLPPATRRCYGRGAAIDLGETFAETVQGETSSNVTANISSDRPASTELACPIILDCEVAIAIALLRRLRGQSGVANRSFIDTPIGSMPLLPQLTNRKETNLFRATDGNHSQAAR
jgi:hypothetical protein